MKISKEFSEACRRERELKKQQEQYNELKKLAKDYLFPQGL